MSKAKASTGHLQRLLALVFVTVLLLIEIPQAPAFAFTLPAPCDGSSWITWMPDDPLNLPPPPA